MRLKLNVQINFQKEEYFVSKYAYVIHIPSN
jgi:hypothetical protein